MKQIYDFGRHTPPALNERMLREALERRSLRRQTLLLLAAGDRQRLWQTLSAQTALCKRTHAPLPAAAAYAIMEDTLGKEGETILS